MFHFELLPIACSPHCLHYIHTILPLGSLWSTWKSHWDETLWAIQCPPHPAIQLGPCVICCSSQNLQHGRSLILSLSAFSTCSKHHNLSRGLMGCDKAMSWWGDETQLCRSPERCRAENIACAAYRQACTELGLCARSVVKFGHEVVDLL